jgi:hypothetical protein
MTYRAFFYNAFIDLKKCLQAVFLKKPWLVNSHHGLTTPAQIQINKQTNKIVKYTYGAFTSLNTLPVVPDGPALELTVRYISPALS